MKELKGTKTEQNLKDAFAGESQARNKYTYYASQARKDGYEQIAEIFEETANNEKEHAKLWFKALNGGSVPTTLENNLTSEDVAKELGISKQSFSMKLNNKREFKSSELNKLVVLLNLTDKDFLPIFFANRVEFNSTCV